MDVAFVHMFTWCRLVSFVDMLTWCSCFCGHVTWCRPVAFVDMFFFTTFVDMLTCCMVDFEMLVLHVFSHVLYTCFISLFVCSYTIVDYKLEQYFPLTPNQPAVNNPRSFTTKRTGWIIMFDQRRSQTL